MGEGRWQRSLEEKGFIPPSIVAPQPIAVLHMMIMQGFDWQLCGGGGINLI
jgi:hypothetical protein